MKSILFELRPALCATLILAGLLGGAYPLVVWVGAQLLFRDQANGSLIVDPDGRVRGSRLLAQSFTADRYFHPRPSVAGSGYDAANSAGSNLGPTSRKLSEMIRADVAAYRARNGLELTVAVPADAVTRSGSGLDPHISVANAERQAARVAQARDLPPGRVQLLIRQHTEDRSLGLLGEPGVNVLLLNLALDRAAPPPLP